MIRNECARIRGEIRTLTANFFVAHPVMQTLRTMSPKACQADIRVLRIMRARSLNRIIFPRRS